MLLGVIGGSHNSYFDADNEILVKCTIYRVFDRLQMFKNFCGLNGNRHPINKG